MSELILDGQYSTSQMIRTVYEDAQELSVTLKSSTTCFICLLAKPDIRLPCQHSYCENCFQMMGRDQVDEPYTWILSFCVFCGKECSELKLKIKPPTAGIRILSVDGGGIRGIIPLQYLKILQIMVDLPHPIQDNFDVAFGTSSGKSLFPFSTRS